MDGRLLYKNSFAVRKPKNVKMYVYIYVLLVLTYPTLSHTFPIYVYIYIYIYIDPYLCNIISIHTSHC